jgi:hypothetical protein
VLNLHLLVQKLELAINETNFSRIFRDHVMYLIGSKLLLARSFPCESIIIRLVVGY